MNSTGKMSVELPECSLDVFNAMIGPDLMKNSLADKKGQIKLDMNAALFETIFDTSLRKILRYGAYLGIKGKLKMTYSKNTKNLKLTGSYVMKKR